MTQDVACGAAVLSLRPRFGRAILLGSKTVELRRVRPRLDSGTTLVLYVGCPVQRIVGVARLDSLATDIPTKLWNAFGKRTGLRRAELEDYLNGGRSPTALCLSSVHPVEPLPLPFRPPQSWLRLRPDNRDHRHLLMELRGQLAQGRGEPLLGSEASAS